MLGFLTDLYDNLDKNHRCVGIFLDLSKAFDLVDHSLLIDKLTKYGFRGKFGDWLCSYLTNRKQFTTVNGCKSLTKNILCGVPQGSVLGPLLFLLFVNDLLSTITESSLILFADDTSCLVWDSNTDNLRTRSQTRLNELVNWFNTNKLLINRDKTVFLQFSPRINEINQSSLLRIDNKSIQQVQAVKFLGIHMNNSLSWETHINELSKHLASSCFALYRLKFVTNRSVMLSYYYAFFYSRLKYGIIFWGSSPHSSRIFKLQKKALRNILSLGNRESCREKFKEMRILTIPCVFIFEIAVYVRSNIHNFKTNNFFHNYSTRFGNDLMLPLHTLSIYEKDPRYCGIQIYNKLPNSIKSISNLKRFKLSLESVLIERSFYSIAEFMADIFSSIYMFILC